MNTTFTSDLYIWKFTPGSPLHIKNLTRFTFTCEKKWFTFTWNLPLHLKKGKKQNRSRRLWQNTTTFLSSFLVRKRTVLMVEKLVTIWTLSLWGGQFLVEMSTLPSRKNFRSLWPLKVTNYSCRSKYRNTNSGKIRPKDYPEYRSLCSFVEK